MTNDIETLITALYVKIDDELSGPRWVGRPPVLTTLPLGPAHPGELAGPAFYMVHPSQFVLPYREAAWKVMVQRLGEMADACAQLGREAGLGQGNRIGPDAGSADGSGRGGW